MNLSDYALQAQSTEATAEASQEERFRHAEMGLYTESAELLDALKKFFIYGKAVDYRNVIEEIGDVAWYAAIPVNHYELTFAGFAPRTVVIPASLSIEEGLLRLCRLLLQNVSMFSRYAVDLEKKGECDRTSVVSTLGNIVGLLRNICDLLDVELEEVLAGNIAKLKARFPDRFTKEAALTRNTEAEMVALEGELGAAG